jgi:hypothetical protein
MDTFIHDTKHQDQGYIIEYGGPGMWLLSLFSLCDMNPRDSDIYTEDIYNDGRGYTVLKMHDYPDWVYA